MTGIQRKNIQHISLNLARRITERIWLRAFSPLTKSSLTAGLQIRKKVI